MLKSVMKKSLLAQSDQLKREGEKLLKKLKIETILGAHGHVVYTGSFEANLMTHGDIDIYVVGTWNKSKVKIIFNKLFDSLNVKGLLLFNWIAYRDPRYPKAWYIGIKDNYQNRKWKIDIWFLTKKQVQQLPFAEWDSIPLSDRQRRTILKFKEYRNKNKLDIQSVEIYKAVLDRNITSLKHFLKHCKE